MAITKTYNPKNNLTDFAGITLFSYAKGTFLTVEIEEDTFSSETGASGETVRIVNNKRGAKVTLTLMAHGPDNDALSAIHAQDRLTGEGIGQFSTKELNGSSFCRGEAWITKFPNIERGDEGPTVQWVFYLPDPDVFVGGLV